jgi:hypothetical protein
MLLRLAKVEESRLMEVQALAERYEIDRLYRYCSGLRTHGSRQFDLGRNEVEPFAASPDDA